MNCPNCQTINAVDDFFCRGCGSDLLQVRSIAHSLATNAYPHATPHLAQLDHAPPFFRQPWFFVSTIILLLSAIVAGLFFGTNLFKQNRALPDHFGVFMIANGELGELRRRELRDFTKEKASLTDSIAYLSSSPIFIVYSDHAIPVDKLKLVSLESLDDNGNYSFTDFRVSPVDGHPEMKEIRVAAPLPNGKYALALFDGYYDDGSHRLWAFQVSNSQNQVPSNLQAAHIALKPLTSIKSSFSAPDNSNHGYCNNRNVILRSSPSLYGNPLGKIHTGQELYVTEVSSNTDNWRGINSNWAYVHLPDGQSGWVFHHFVTYR